MNYNILGYSIFIVIIVLIVVLVGKICYRNGNIFIASLIPGHIELCQQINKTLLIGYYLVNIGYAAMTLSGWELITSLPFLIEVIAKRIAVIVSILSIMHYFNIIILTTNIQKLIKSH